MTQQRISGQITGFASSAKISNRIETELLWSSEAGVQIDALKLVVADVQQLSISPRVGQINRHLDFPDGSSFETADIAGVDALIKALGYRHQQGFIAVLEASKRFIVLSLLASVLLVYLFVQFGIPALARPLSKMVPVAVSEQLGDYVLDHLTELGMRPTELSAERQRSLQRRFDEQVFYVGDYADQYILPPQLQFRRGGLFAANALAIPNGTIIVTDELVELAENDEQIFAVIGHELGHLYHLHSLRSAIQQFGLAIVVMSISGDVAAASGTLATLPVVLAATHYSRELESEADDFALQILRDWQLSPMHFARIMARLQASGNIAYRECLDETDEAKRQACIDESIQSGIDKPDADSVIESYLSTHPLSHERIEKFEQAESIDHVD